MLPRAQTTERKGEASIFHPHWQNGDAQMLWRNDEGLDDAQVGIVAARPPVDFFVVHFPLRVPNRVSGVVHHGWVETDEVVVPYPPSWFNFSKKLQRCCAAYY